MYVQRNNEGLISAVYGVEQPGLDLEFVDGGEELDAFLAPTQNLPAVSLQQVAGARLVVDQDNWEVTGVERSVGVAGAFLVDVDLVYVFFSEPQPNTLYEVTPSAGVTKYPDFVEVTRPGLSELNFIVQRVQ